jgi:hypothetical protein
MPVTFQICQVYNKVFYRNLNKLAYSPPVIISLPMGLFWPSLSLGWFQDRIV